MINLNTYIDRTFSCKCVSEINLENTKYTISYVLRYNKLKETAKFKNSVITNGYPLQKV